MSLTTSQSYRATTTTSSVTSPQPWVKMAQPTRLGLQALGGLNILGTQENEDSAVRLWY